MAEQRDDRIFPTEAGASDGRVGDGEPMTGRAGRANQEEASDFYEELGAVVEGKEGEDVHHADRGGMGPVDRSRFVTDAGVSDGTVGDGEPMTGHAGEANQEAASDFYEELGAIVEGKAGDDVHHADMEP